MPNALMTINRIARTLKKEHPSMKHTSAIRQASAIYRKDHHGHGKVSGEKKHHTKKRHMGVGSKKRKRLGATNGTDRVDNKKVHVTIGGLTPARARKYLKDQTEEKLAFALLARDQAKNKTERNKLSKYVQKVRGDLRRYE